MPHYQYRDAKTGAFLSAEEAKAADPATVIRETITPDYKHALLAIRDILNLVLD